jgi:hypothetical protein
MTTYDFPVKARASLIALLPALLAGAVATPIRAANASLDVVGRIVPSESCDMTVGNGPISFGQIHLNPDPSRPTKIDEQRIKVAIKCEGGQRYALIAGSVASSGLDDPRDFGLVSGSDGSTTGSLFVRIDSDSDRIEGRRGYHTAADSALDLGSAAWGPSTFSVWPIARGMAIGFVKTDGSFAVPEPIADFYTYILVSGEIRPADELDRTEEIAFSGDVGFEIHYF